MYLAFLASAFDVLTLFPFSFAIAFASCDSRKIPPPPPPGGQRKFRGGGGGGGGLKGRNLQGVWGVPTRRIFHRVVKDAIDPTRHTCIYGFF